MDRERARAALERDLSRYRATPTPAPPRGWVRAIRDALGMTTRDLARRAGVSHPRITQIEQGEVNGSVTLGTLQRIAGAMGCRLEYVLVPERPLDEMVREQAQRKAAEVFDEVAHTMALEDQRTDDAGRHRQIERLADALAERRGLWSER